jgi:hypothetical protein
MVNVAASRTTSGNEIPALETRNRPTKYKSCRKMPKRRQAAALQRKRTGHRGTKIVTFQQ